MTSQEAKNLLSNRDIWELKNMKKALSFLGAFNTPDEVKKLRAIKILLKEKEG